MIVVVVVVEEGGGGGGGGRRGRREGEGESRGKQPQRRMKERSGEVGNEQHDVSGPVLYSFKGRLEGGYSALEGTG